MTAKTIKVPSLPAGLTVSCKVRNLSTLAVLETVSLTAGSGDDNSVYTGTITGAHAGQLLFDLIVSGVVIESRIRTIQDVAATFVILTELERIANNGRGAHPVTLTVTDGTNGLENATVRVSIGVLSASDDTDPDGLVKFALNSGTYTVTITLPGFQPLVQTLVVSGLTTHTYALTAQTVTPPASPLVSTGILKVLDEEAQPEGGVNVHLQLVSGRGVAGFSLDKKIRTATSDASGDVQFPNLIRGATYAVWSGEAAIEAASPFAVRSSSVRNTFTVPNSDSFNIAEFIRLDAEA
jgi:hypothetical protein